MGKTAQKQHQKEKPKGTPCPKCGADLKVHRCIRIRMNGKSYGANGYFWLCTKCDYMERRLRRRRKHKPRESKKKKRIRSKMQAKK